MNKIILSKLLVLIILFNCCEASEEISDGDNSVDDSNCLDQYECINQVFQKDIYHHCNLWKKIGEICNNSEAKLYDDPVYYEPAHEEENEIEDGEERIEEKSHTVDDLLFVPIQRVQILITPCDKRRVPDQRGICQIVFFEL